MRYGNSLMSRCVASRGSDRLRRDNTAISCGLCCPSSMMFLMWSAMAVYCAWGVPGTQMSSGFRPDGRRARVRVGAGRLSPFLPPGRAQGPLIVVNQAGHQVVPAEPTPGPHYRSGGAMVDGQAAACRFRVVVKEPLVQVRGGSAPAVDGLVRVQRNSD